MEKPKVTAESGYEALQAHVQVRAALARERYGPVIDLAAIQAILADREIVRFPTELRFDLAPLRSGEFGWAQPLGDRPSDGFAIVLHPAFEGHPDVPLLVAYQLVAVNYLDLATADEAEVFAATLLGIGRDEAYQSICGLVDSLPAR